MPTIRRGAPVLLALWPYLMLAAALLPEETAAAAAELWWLLTPAVLLANLWNACTLGDPGRSVRTCLWVKLVHIPFYLLLFAAGAVMVLAMVVPAFTLLTPLLLLMLAGMEWVLLAVGSSYGIAGALGLRRAGVFTRAGTAVRWSQWPWVRRMASGVRPLSRTRSRIRGASSPGSARQQRPAASSPSR